MKIRKMKLTGEEKRIERDLEKGVYIDAPKEEFEEIAEMLRQRKKDAVLSIRVNRVDLDNIKKKAQKLGVRYQSLISELIHQAAG